MYTSCETQQHQDISAAVNEIGGRPTNRVVWEKKYLYHRGCSTVVDIMIHKNQRIPLAFCSVWRHDQKAACWPTKSKVLIFVETTQGRKMFHQALIQKAFVTIAPLCADLIQLRPLYFLWPRPDFTRTRWFIISCLAKDLFTPMVTKIVRNALCRNLFPPQFPDNWKHNHEKTWTVKSTFSIVPTMCHRHRAMSRAQA